MLQFKLGWPCLIKLFAVWFIVFAGTLVYLLTHQVELPGNGRTNIPNIIRQIQSKEDIDFQINNEGTSKLRRKVDLRDTIPSHLNREKTTLRLHEKSFKKILIWNVFHGYGDSLGFGYGHEPFLEARCEVSNCITTADRYLVPLKDFDAIIFHFRATTLKDLPWERSERQRWIVWEVESASYGFQSPHRYDQLFNWTFTFRRDSDIYDPYGRVLRSINSTIIDSNKTKNSSNAHMTDLFPKRSEATIVDKRSSKNPGGGKTKMAAWFVSNCYAHSRREKYVKALQTFLQVDIFGKCGTMTCSLAYNNDCYQMLEQEYKFYLSFENSLCKDYVTEKFFNILRYNVVPVVLGLADYANIAPPNSFINALDFPDVNSLAKYLLYLATNNTAYNQYFKWKESYTVHVGWSNRALAFCDICKKLHEDQHRKTYENLQSWFITEAECKTIKWYEWMDSFE